MRQAMMKATLLLALATLAGGCAQGIPPTTESAAPPAGMPLSLVGQDTGITLDFSVHPVLAVDHELQEDEICYLTVGDAMLICAADGSYLLFGPEDGITLVKDNPLARLRPVGHSASGTELMHTLSTLALIAGSVDRLPDGFANYLDDPGPHRRQALAEAKKILADNGAELAGSARGGTFKVWMQLNDSGRQKLEEAVDGEVNENGIYMVGDVRGPSRRAIRH